MDGIGNTLEQVRRANRFIERSLCQVRLFSAESFDDSTFDQLTEAIAQAGTAIAYMRSVSYPELTNCPELLAYKQNLSRLSTELERTIVELRDSRDQLSQRHTHVARAAAWAIAARCVDDLSVTF